MANYRIALRPDLADIPRLLDWVEACCAADGVVADTALKLALALEEVVANTVNHGFRQIAAPQRIEVRLEIGRAAIIAEVIDNAPPFNPCATPPPDIQLPLEQRKPGGLGIRLIHGLIDRITYKRADGENRLRLEKARS
jgi:serine/threonine-protein kinase RsbW